MSDKFLRFRKIVGQKLRTKGGVSMGNLIKDFWTYQYKGNRYYGICEVVMGEDLQQKRHEAKYETHIEKALKVMMEPGNDFVSHMSIQKYNGFMKDRASRSHDEEAYYPFFMEFEPKIKDNGNMIEQIFNKQYKEAAGEALRVVLYAIGELGYHEEDILIMINNSRSIYVMFNPRSYDLKPSKFLHRIYAEMYKAIDDEIGLNYVDISLYNHYGLMKTPNTYYKGGYFTKISLDQLKKLYGNPQVKTMLTSRKRSLDYYIPGKKALGMARLYEEAIETVKDRQSRRKKTKDQVTYITSCPAKCIEHIENHLIDQGCRNHALVSVGIYYKNQGFNKDQVIGKLMELAKSWNHDENYAAIRSKAATIFRYDYKFSCEYARQKLDLDMDSVCSKCPYNKGNAWRSDKIAVQSGIIEELWSNNASTRHYLAYLELSRKNLFNRWINPEETGIKERTIRELCKHTSYITKEKNKDLIYITNNAAGNVYYLPVSFLANEVHIRLGEYIKHYLKLLIKGYKSFDKHILLRVSAEKIMQDLGYSEMSGVYKFIKKLKDELGLAAEKNGKIVALYFESRKIKDIQEYKEKKNNQSEAFRASRRESKTEQLNITASGESCNQIEFDFDTYRGPDPGSGSGSGSSRRNKRGSPG